ncbi:catalase-related domain-containing protein [Streptosporangium sp. CA-135522]|uniref:catalase-related domain-containing protein n=1 Tax=Streptosporangium sp. CA-135522 TaxID=3240072 RepID=UPI003D914A7E
MTGDSRTDKDRQLDEARVDFQDTVLTTDQGIYSRATLFGNSMSGWEKEHVVAAFRFELGKAAHAHVREGVIHDLDHVDHDLAVLVAEAVAAHRHPTRDTRRVPA